MNTTSNNSLKIQQFKDSALHILNELSMQNKKSKYPNVPNEWLPKSKYTDKTANDLTKCIIHFLKLKGWQGERINNTGRPVIHSKAYNGPIWHKGSGTKGTADISATIAGRSVKIEVKIGADRQSEYQKSYQSMIEQAGGLYVIAKTFQGFYEWYNKIFEL